MSGGELAVVAVAVFGAATMYMIAGFGFALLAMPLMTLAIPVEQAVVIVTLLAVGSTGWQAIAHRRSADRPVARRLIIAAYAGMPFGLLLLNVASDRVLRIVLGIGVLFATAVLARNLHPKGGARTLDAVMGFISGLANTSIGTNGPPMVYALQSRQLGPAAFLGTIAVVMAFSNVFTVILFAIDGKITGDGLRGAALAFPAWAIGCLLGRRIQPRVPEERFRTIVLALLFATGLAAIVFAL